MEARFNLRQTKDENKATPINLVCTINSKQEKFPTGQKICPKYWDKSQQIAIVSNTLSRAIQRQNKKVNEALNVILTKFEEWDSYMQEHPEEQDRATDKLRTFLRDERNRLEIAPLEWFESYVNDNTTTSAGTKKKYLADLKTISQFVEEKKVKLNKFSDLNFNFIDRYEKYLTDLGRRIATIINKQRSFLAWIHEAEKQGLINPIETGISRYKLPKNKETGTQIYLTEKELQKMQNLHLEGNEKSIRDIFLLQCQLGQRYGDMMNLDKAVINKKEISLIQEKTGKKVTIPLNNIAKNILKEYNNRIPYISNEYANELLKTIGEKAGINEEIIISVQKGHKIESKKVAKYTLIGTHTARRTFITSSTKKRIAPNVIMKITGHVSFKTMENYNKMTPDDVANILLEQIDLEEEKLILK